MENPLIHPITNETKTNDQGMRLRDYFAAKAMQGILSNPDWMKEYKGDKYLMESRIVSEVSYGIADEMLKQRKL